MSISKVFFFTLKLSKRYYPAIRKFVKKVTGAKHVFCFDHNIRRSTFVEQTNTEIKVQKPIPQVHTDYTPSSAPRRLLDLTQKPKANDSYASFRAPDEKDTPLIPLEFVNNCSRFCILNVWRSVSDEGPIQQYPLAVCAADSLKYPEDFVVFEIHYKDRIGENWFVRDNSASTSKLVETSSIIEKSPNHHHKWYYYPRMRKDEALIFKQWDSEGRIQREVAKTVLEKLNKENAGGEALKTMTSLVEKTSAVTQNSSDRNLSNRANDGFSDFCIHSAFDDPNTKRIGSVQVPDRESIEVRCFALFE